VSDNIRKTILINKGSVKRKITIARSDNLWSNKEKGKGGELQWLYRLIGSTNATGGPKAVFTCWEFFGPLWLHVNEWILSETQAKYLFMRWKQKTAMYYKKSYKYYIINYYYCYDYYLQWLLYHYRIIRRINNKKRHRYTYIVTKYCA